MPKDTFFNIPKVKREKIINAAIDEFCEYTYHKASITRIVERAHIAKGSFYQYFDDKGDLFRYLMDVSVQEKMMYFQQLLANIQDKDFFYIVRELYIAGIKFAQDRPKLSKIANDLIKESDTKLKEEILGNNLPKSNNLFEMLLAKGIDKGTIDPNIDVELVAFMFTSLSVSIGDYFIKEVKADDEMELMKLIDNMLYVFGNGIRNR